MRSSLTACVRTAFLAAALSAAPLVAQTGTIRGKVVDSSGAPVPGALIAVDRTAVRTQANSSGLYTLLGVPAGARTVRAQVIGFTPTSIDVTVTANGTVTQDLTLIRSAVQLSAVDVVVGSRASHKAADEIAVPVDIIPAEVIAQQGTSELSSILQSVSPSVNFPRQSVTDADDIVRPFTMRGLSPDHTLVLVNGIRRHRSALVHTFAFGEPAGATGVDLNALPASAIGRMEVLRDGASAQYGSEAIAGVLNLVIKDGQFSPFVNADVGRYFVKDFPDDGNTFNVNGGWGVKLGRGSLGLFGEYRNRQPTNRAWPEAADQLTVGDADEVDANGKIISKNNPVDQPNHHLGDGLANDALTFANLRLPINASGTSELYGFGGYTHRIGTGNGFYRQGLSERNWPEIYPQGFLPEFRPTVVDWSGAAGVRGVASKWNYDAALSLGRNVFDYQLRNTLNASLGPCLTTACAPGLDGILGNADDPGIPNSTHFFAGGLRAGEMGVNVNVARPVEVGLPNALNVALGAAYRRETFELVPGEKGSWIQGGHLNRNGDPAPPGSQVFSGFLPSTAADESRGNTGVYVDLETDLTKQLLVNAAARFEDYSDFGSKLSSKLAVRLQPAQQLVLRGALSTGFRAPSLAQSFYGSRITNFRLDPTTGRQTPFESGIFPVNDPVAVALGSRPLKAETSVNYSAGFAWSPTDRFNLTADGYLIDLNDRILLTGFIGGDSVEKILASKKLPLTSAQYFTNILDTRTKGVDLTANYRAFVGAGALTLTTGMNYTTNRIADERALPSQLEGTGAELVDKFATIQIERERPDWRGTVTADYSRGQSNALLRTSYYGKFHSAPGLCDTCEQEFGGKTLVDLEVGRRFGAVRWSLGARNLFDTFPDKNSLDNGYGIFPWAGASPFGYNGRFLYTRAEWVLGK
ncbi:MAG TPA: TonB-dependent receptor [Gemmatimonadaceae bacterium]|nr:TonB-dependent receptor [Gemmatimonadaceae bacterium]